MWRYKWVRWLPLKIGKLVRLGAIARATGANEIVGIVRTATGKGCHMINIISMIEWFRTPITQALLAFILLPDVIGSIHALCHSLACPVPFAPCTLRFPVGFDVFALGCLDTRWIVFLPLALAAFIGFLIGAKPTLNDRVPAAVTRASPAPAFVRVFTALAAVFFQNGIVVFPIVGSTLGGGAHFAVVGETVARWTLTALLIEIGKCGRKFLITAGTAFGRGYRGCHGLVLAVVRRYIAVYAGFHSQCFFGSEQGVEKVRQADVTTSPKHDAQYAEQRQYADGKRPQFVLGYNLDQNGIFVFIASIWQHGAILYTSNKPILCAFASLSRGSNLHRIGSSLRTLGKTRFPLDKDQYRMDCNRCQ